MRRQKARPRDARFYFYFTGFLRRVRLWVVAEGPTHSGLDPGLHSAWAQEREQEAMPEDSAQIDLPQPLRPDFEEIFGEICYAVRERSAAPPDSEAVASYAVQLLEEIEQRARAGTLGASVYEYCLQAAGEILSLEAVYCENRFVKI